MTKINLVMYCEEVYSLFSGEFSKSRFGGAGLQMYFLANEFAKDPRYQVRFMFCRHDASLLSHPSIRFINYPKLISHGIPGISRIINNKRKRAFVDTSEEATIFFTTMALNAQLAADMQCNFGVKSILRVASDSDVLSPHGIASQSKEQVFAAMVSVSQVVVQSNYQKNVLAKNRNLDSLVIENGIPLNEVRLGDERKHVLWVASAQELKQPHYFLDLAATFPQQKFVMVMPYGVYSVMDGLEKRAAELKNLELIKEQLTLEKTNELFSQAKVFVNTSSIEGFPNTFLQAAAAGTPILSLLINPDGVLEKYGIGVSMGGSIWQLPKELEKLLIENEYWSAISQNGPAYIRAHRDIVNSAQRYKEIFASIVEG